MISDVGQEPENNPGFASTISKNIVASLARVVAVSLVALLLPAYLTHHLPVATYAAWVLILQLAAYVSYLDLGIQTGVSKFVAEYDARNDSVGAGRHASAGLVLMIFAGLFGILLTAILAWQVPRLFSTMPIDLYHDVRMSVLLVGSSLSFGLVCAVYSAVFLGLQRYWVPMTISIGNRAIFVTVVVAVVALHGSLTAMGVGVALVNVLTGITQIIAWRTKASHIRVSRRLADRPVLVAMARYCSMQSIWTVGMMCVSGLDITIVGHYDYGQTAYYSIATLPTNFLLLILGSAMGPLMPASSAMSTQRTPSQMGDFTIKITRYTTVLSVLTGLLLVVCGYPLLRLWVGSGYAFQTVSYLRILILANVIRSLCAPYASMICATGRQGAAVATAFSEAAVNLGSSVYLASRYGAIGVAMGTLLGSFVSVSLHFIITMAFTRETLIIDRFRLFYNGMLRPAVIALPSVFLLPFWWSTNLVAMNPVVIVLWGLSTLIVAWTVALSKEDQGDLRTLLRSQLRPNTYQQ